MPAFLGCVANPPGTWTGSCKSFGADPLYVYADCYNGVTRTYQRNVFNYKNCVTGTIQNSGGALTCERYPFWPAKVGLTP